jgi:hypothetical protein
MMASGPAVTGALPTITPPVVTSDRVDFNLRPQTRQNPYFSIFQDAPEEAQPIPSSVRNLLASPFGAAPFLAQMMSQAGGFQDGMLDAEAIYQRALTRSLVGKRAEASPPYTVQDYMQNLLLFNAPPYEDATPTPAPESLPDGLAESMASLSRGAESLSTPERMRYGYQAYAAMQSLTS